MQKFTSIALFQDWNSMFFHGIFFVILFMERCPMLMYSTPLGSKKRHRFKTPRRAEIN